MKSASINRRNTECWKADVQKSVLFYNNWFLDFAPATYVAARKSAGDFTNTNKRRKEEAIKIEQLRKTYGNGAGLVLFLCGYFDSGYLGYEAAEGIDWVWEHRVADLEKAGV